MIAESRIIAESLLKKLPDNGWKKLIFEDNVLQKKSLNTASRNAYTLRKRLEPLGDGFIKTLLKASDRAYIQLLMVAFLMHSPVVADFMRQSLAEARRTYKPCISPTAWADFMEDRLRAFPELGGYSESTIKKMGNNAMKALVDSGYLDSSRNRQIQQVFILPEVRACLQELGRTDLIDVMECTT